MLLAVGIVMPFCHIFSRLDGRVLARTVQRNDLCISVRMNEESDRSTGNSAFCFAFGDHDSVDLSVCRDDDKRVQETFVKSFVKDLQLDVELSD